MRNLLIVVFTILFYAGYSQNVSIAIHPKIEVGKGKYFHKIFSRNGMALNDSNSQILQTFYNGLSKAPIGMHYTLISNEVLGSEDKVVVENGSRKFYTIKKDTSKLYFQKHSTLKLTDASIAVLKANAEANKSDYVAVVHAIKFRSTFIRRLFRPNSETVSFSVDVYDASMNKVYGETVVKKLRITSGINELSLTMTLRSVSQDLNLLLENIVRR